MNGEVKIKLNTLTLDCLDPNALGKFYSALLSWDIVYADDDYVTIAPPGVKQGDYPGILFQRNPEYKPPVWPEESGAQQQMAHIDFLVNDLEKSTQYATQCGAIISGKQFSKNWTVMFDPAGHPFCLCKSDISFG
jgi:hypothetical protein